MKKEGFISTALIYTFFTLFLVLMVFLLNNYSSTRFLVDRYRYDIEEELYELSSADINLYVYIWDDNDNEYKYKNFVPTTGFRENVSYCKNKSEINYNNGEFTIYAKQKDFCYVYFDAIEGTITNPIVTASDGIESNGWHNNAITLSFSGSEIENAEGSVVYYHGDSYSNMTNNSTTTSLLSNEGISSYYVKACSSVETELCSDTIEYILKIDKTAPTCSLSVSGTNFVATYSDNGGSNVNTSSSSETPQAINSAKTYTFTVYDNAGNSGSCSAIVTDKQQTGYTCKKNYDACPEGWNWKETGCFHYAYCNSTIGTCNCLSYSNKNMASSGVTSSQCSVLDSSAEFIYCTFTATGCASCPSGYHDYGSADYCYKSANYSECSSGTKENGACYKKNQSSCATGWTNVGSSGSACSSGYTAVGNYCYKIN